MCDNFSLDMRSPGSLMCYNCGCQKKKHDLGTKQVSNRFDDIFNKFNKQCNIEEPARNERMKLNTMMPSKPKTSCVQLNEAGLADRNPEAGNLEDRRPRALDRKAKTVFMAKSEDKRKNDEEKYDFSKITQKFEEQKNNTRPITKAIIKNQEVVGDRNKSEITKSTVYNPAAKLLTLHSQALEKQTEADLKQEEPDLKPKIQSKETQIQIQVTDLDAENADKFAKLEKAASERPKLPMDKLNETGKEAGVADTQTSKVSALVGGNEKTVEKYSQMLRNGNKKTTHKRDSSSSSDSDCNKKRVKNKIKPFKRRETDSSDNE